MRPAVEAQLRYLEILRTQGLLEERLAKRLPAHVDQAARIAACVDTKDIDWDRKTGTVYVTPEDDEEAKREIEGYLIHFGYKKKGPVVPIFALPPREIRAGYKYSVARGSLRNRVVKIIGEDQKLWGLAWWDNIGNPVCERFVYRIQFDKLPITGRVFLCQDGENQALVHELELGGLVQ